jgi:hypothetical protein
MLGEVAWTASPISATRRFTQGPGAISSIGEKYLARERKNRLRMVDTGSSKSRNSWTNRSSSPSVGSCPSGALMSA